MVLAISSVVMSLSTLRRVTGVSPVMSLRSAGAGWGIVNNIVTFRLIRERFKLKNKDKLRVNLKYPAYHILA